jgi:hypothetical protein
MSEFQNHFTTNYRDIANNIAKESNKLQVAGSHQGVLAGSTVVP